MTLMEFFDELVLVGVSFVVVAIILLGLTALLDIIDNIPQK